MIAAATVGWFRWLFARHARSRLLGTFGRIWLSGDAELGRALREGPVLVIANHTSWWDPLVALWLARSELRADAYALMDAKNLRRLAFFGRVGAFGADLDDRRDGARAIRYAARLLDRPERLVWIFPEGRERSPFEPLVLRPGAGAIARLAGAPVVPVAIRYLFASREKPELWISVGAAVPADADLTAALAGELRHIDAQGADFRLVHDAPPSRLGAFAERALSALARLF